MKKETVTRYRDEEGHFAKKPDDFDEEAEALGKLVDSITVTNALGLVCCILVVALLVAGVVIHKLVVMSPGATHSQNVSQISGNWITSPAMFADPQLKVAPLETPTQTVIIVGPFTVRGWRGGEPVLFESR